MISCVSSSNIRSKLLFRFHGSQLIQTVIKPGYCFFYCIINTHCSIGAKINFHGVYLLARSFYTHNMPLNESNYCLAQILKVNVSDESPLFHHAFQVSCHLLFHSDFKKPKRPCYLCNQLDLHPVVFKYLQTKPP